MQLNSITPQFSKNIGRLNKKYKQLLLLDLFLLFLIVFLGYRYIWLKNSLSNMADRQFTSKIMDLQCSSGAIIKWSNGRLICDFDKDNQELVYNTHSNTLTIKGGNQVSLSDLKDTYKAGDGLTLYGNTFAIRAPVCMSNQKLMWNGSAFVCATDIDTDLLSSLNCAPNQIPKWNGSSWVCSNDDTGTALPTGTVVGSIVHWNGTSWVENTNFIVDASGNITSGTWQGTPIDISDYTNLSAGNGLQLVGDTVSVNAPICNSGEVLTWGGTNFVCTPDNDTTYTASGTLLQLSGTTFSIREGTLTDGKLCTYDAINGLVCNTDVNSVGTDNQTLTWTPSSNELSISGGNIVVLSELAQTLSLSGDVLTISHTGSSVDLSVYRQSLTWDAATDQLSISGGNTVDLSDLTQSLSFDGTTGQLTISSGNTVDLSTFWDNTDNQTLTLSGNVLFISGGNSVTFSNWDTDVTDDVQNLTDLQDVTVTSPSTNQVLKYNGTNWVNSVLNFIDLGDTPTNYGTSGFLLQTDGVGNIQYVDPLTLDVGYWQRSGTTISPRNAGDDIVLNTGETLTISDFVQGGLVFAGSGGLLVQDASSLYWDDTNNRLGVGTTAPTTTLEVVGDIFSNSGQIRLGGFSAAPVAIGPGSLYYDTSANLPYYFDGATWIPLAPDPDWYRVGTTAVPTSINDDIYTYGRVGVGTNSPTEKLTVVGADDSFNPVVGFSTTGGVRVGIGGNLSYGWIQSFNSKPLYINPWGNNTLINHLSGKVGIGTWSPTAKLTVRGGDSTANGAGVIDVQTFNGTSLRLGGDSAYSWIQSHGSKPLYINPKGNNLILNLEGGNVGIGTSFPSSKLHIFDSGLGGELLKVESQYATQTSFLTGWTYRRQVTINNPNTTTLSEFQVKIVLDTQSLITASKMRSDCGDIRVTAADGITQLPYWVEPDTCNTTNTLVWVKLDLQAASTTYVYLYYGNSGATNASNGNAVFDFFDDFNGVSLDTTKWNAHPGNGSITVGGGALHIQCTSGIACDWWGGNIEDGAFVSTIQAFNYDSVFETYMTGTRSASSLEIHTGIGEYTNLDNVSFWGIYSNNELRLEGVNNNVGGTIGGVPDSRNTYKLSIVHIPSGGTRPYTANYGEVTIDSANPFNDDHYLILFGKTWGTAPLLDAYFYWVRVRKYAAQEPNVSIGIEETATTTTGPLQVNFIVKDGLVGIHTANPQYPLQVGDPGDGTVAISNAWLTFSDRNWKEDVVDINSEEALSKVLQLQGVSYTWKASKERDVGFIAQDVVQILPDIVKQLTDGSLAIDYNDFVPYVVEAIKALDAKIEEISTQGGASSYWTLNNNILETSYDVNIGKLVSTQLIATDVSASTLSSVSLEVGNGSFRVDANGDVAVKGDAVINGSLSVSSVVTDSIQIRRGSNMSGSVVLAAMRGRVVVNVQGLSAEDVVIVTLKEGPMVPYFVKVGDGQFVIYLTEPVSSEMTFNYVVIKRQ